MAGSMRRWAGWSSNHGTSTQNHWPHVSRMHPRRRTGGCDHGRMTAWRDGEQAEPGFAQRGRALFDAPRTKTIATLRADGSPRISGIEAAFEDGELAFGSMADARKGADLRRDPRFAPHSATVDPVGGAEAQWQGEAKISGRAVAARPITEGPDGDRFQADIAEVVHTHLNAEATMLVVEWWTPAHGLGRTEREKIPGCCRVFASRRPRSMKRIIQSKLSSGSASHWKPREASSMANPWMVLRMVRMAWFISSSPMPYPRSPAAIELSTRVLAASSGSSGPLNSAPTVAV